MAPKSPTSKPAKPKTFNMMVDGKQVRVPVSATVFAHFDEQFVRASLSHAQKKRRATLNNLVRAGYMKGKQDGKGGPKN